jgi:biopolymer transport protein ExbB
MEKLTLFDLFEKGQWAMWPLLVFSIITITILLERFVYIFYHDLSIRKVGRKVLEKIKAGDIKGAKEYLRNCKKRVVSAPVILSGLNVFELGEHRMEKAIEAGAAGKLSDLERGFSILVALGSLAPITGFLGTVSGMITAFQSIANASDVNAQLVANGIFEALITTAFGLVIAIIAVAGFNFLSFFVDKFAADIEQLGNEVLGSALAVSGDNNKNSDKVLVLNEN